MNPLLFTHFTATSCAGRGLDATLAALAEGRGGLAPCDFEGAALSTFAGRVAGIEDAPVRADLAEFDCRNNRLAQMAMTQDGFDQRVRDAITRHGADRVGVFMGTSTAGILETERAYRQRDPANGALPAGFNYATTHNPYSLAAFVRAYFGLRGPAVSVSSACSSGAKVFGSARRMLETGLIDVAVVGGVDTLCLTTLYGFNSLELLAPGPCKPFDRHRDGISIGEAAAFGLLERETAGHTADDDAIRLLGIGESSDAHHMSSPHPDGLGARMAMEQALASAGLDARDIGYVNLHGTATPSNDAAESRALTSVFDRVPCSSTKGATGHTLGAAGALEAVVAALALRHQMIPAGVNATEPDPALGLDYVIATRHAPLRAVLSNSFGFGGTNCSLVFGRGTRGARSGFGMIPLRAYIEGIGVIGPGLADWPRAADVLAQRAVREAVPTVLPAPAGLPSAERRRTGPVVRAALAAAHEAVAASGRDAATLASVFAASGGDGGNFHAICETLASDEPQLSPTRFHNSVHNAPAGYWSIATRAMAASNVLCAYDGSFAAGLLESLAQVSVDGVATLLVAYDTEYPEPLRRVRPIADAFGVALVLAPEKSARTLARIEARLTDAPALSLADAALEALRLSNPAARALPLLEAIACKRASGVVLDYLDGTRLAVDVEPS